MSNVSLQEFKPEESLEYTMKLLLDEFKSGVTLSKLSEFVVSKPETCQAFSILLLFLDDQMDSVFSIVDNFNEQLRKPNMSNSERQELEKRKPDIKKIRDSLLYKYVEDDIMFIRTMRKTNGYQNLCFILDEFKSGVTLSKLSEFIVLKPELCEAFKMLLLILDQEIDTVFSIVINFREEYEILRKKKNE